MTTYFLMISGLAVHNEIDQTVLREWFPWHHLQEHRATAFYLACIKLEVLEVVAKAQVLNGDVCLGTVEEFGRWVSDTYESNEVGEGAGRVIRMHTWMQEMQESGHVSEDEDNEGDRDDEESAEDLFDSSGVPATGEGSEIDEGYEMSIDSDDVDSVTEECKTSAVTFLDEKMLDQNNTHVYEVIGWPLSSYYGALL